ncbi:hypothetical protein Tco_0022326 [Tanacetum coccineum]
MLDDPYVQVALQVPPSPDYIPGPEEPQSPPLPDFVPEPVYPEYMPQEDEVFPAEEQPLPTAASPTAQSPDYVPESDPEEDLEEDDDEDPEEDPVDYPADGGNDGDDEDESSEDDEDDDDVDIEADNDEGEEHPALADSAAVALPAADQAPFTDATDTFATTDSDATSITTSITTTSTEAASTSHSLPLPPPIILSHTRPAAPSSRTPPLHLLSTDRREDKPEVTLPPRKRLGIALGPAYEVRESSPAAAARPV